MTFTPLLAEGAWPPGNSWVLRDHKIVYISTTKVACSSLRWMIADLAGEDFEMFYRAPGDHQTRLMTIHATRGIWQHAPQIKSVSPEQRAEISRDAGWLIFAVVRDPWTRLFSAWQSKMLVRHASFVARYADEPWFPRVPRSPDDVLADWRAFVRATPWRSHPELRRDPHFMPQVKSVHPDTVNYSRVYSLSQMRELESDVHAHLAGLGRDQQLYLPRANESPLRMTRECLDAETAEIISEAYRVDLDAFPGRWALEDLKLSDTPWTVDAIDAVGYHGVANERIGDLSRELQRARRTIRALEREARHGRWVPGVAVQAARQARSALRARNAES